MAVEQKESASEEAQDFNLFAGAETGIFKGLRVSKKCSIAKNFEKVSNLTKEHSISRISWGEDENEILVAQRSQRVKVFDVKDKTFSSVVETSSGSGPILGLARYDGGIVTAVESGLVKWWKYNNHVEINTLDAAVKQMGKLRKEGKKEQGWTEEEKEKHAESLKIGRKLCRMRQCPAAPNLVAVGGKELDLQVWDLDNPQEAVFRAKNVRPDFLELRVPVWISDLVFLSKTTVATCSRHGHIRKYDLSSSQRRPAVELIWTEKDENQTCTAICAINENQVIVGTATGKLALWDFSPSAGFKGLVRKFKGCTGAVKDISASNSHSSTSNSNISTPTAGGGVYFAAVGLDRHMRVYNIKEKKPIFSIYLKSRLTGVLMPSNFDPEPSASTSSAKPVNVENEVDDDISELKGEDSDDSIIIEEPEDDEPETSIAETRLDNLLSLPDHVYRDKAHRFHEFFADTKQLRRTLKATESDLERSATLAKIRAIFETFQQAHATGPLAAEPSIKKRRVE